MVMKINSTNTYIHANEDSLTILFTRVDQQKCIICRNEVNKNMVTMPKTTKIGSFGTEANVCSSCS